MIKQHCEYSISFITEGFKNGQWPDQYLCTIVSHCPKKILNKETQLINTEINRQYKIIMIFFN